MAINVNDTNMTINKFSNIFHKEKFPEGSQSWCPTYEQVF